MAKVKQPLEENGIHRAKMWEIMMYALNNTSTNTYMMVVGYISYFLIGIVGLASVLAGSIVTIMRIWDGVTDPFVGMMVDKTNGNKEITRRKVSVQNERRSRHNYDEMAHIGQERSDCF